MPRSYLWKMKQQIQLVGSVLPFQRSLRMCFWVALLSEHELDTVRALTSDGFAAGSTESQRCAGSCRQLLRDLTPNPGISASLVPAPRAVTQSQTTDPLPPSQCNSEGSVLCWQVHQDQGEPCAAGTICHCC